jgi:Zn finger protein HypA/HybF involved in hydrogenase expression
MTRINLARALLEVEDVDAVNCRSCSATADEGETHCPSCKSYWEDCDAGLWEGPWPQEQRSTK